jgi:hypothetical protein
MSHRTAAVTIDVDGVRHYHAIHGLAPPSGADVVVERGVRRFLELCDRVGVVSTLFVVGADLADDAFATLVRRASRAGHEIASHSHAHDYALVTRAPAEIEADIARSVEAITDVTSTKPRGFRAPGYNVSEPLFDALEKLGFAYDSSLLPSTPYFAARTAHIALQWAKRARSSSIVGSARAFVSTPRRAYRPKRGKAWQEARSRVEGRDVVELPISSLFGVPFFGSALAFAPTAVAAATSAIALSASQPCVLELHAIDLCDAGDGFDPALVAARRDLRVPVQAKLARLGSALRVLAQAADVETLLSASGRADPSF